MGFDKLGFTRYDSGILREPFVTAFDDDAWGLYVQWRSSSDSSAYYDLAWSYSTVARGSGESAAWSEWSDQQSRRWAKADQSLSPEFDGTGYVRKVTLSTLIPGLLPGGSFPQSEYWENRVYDAIRLKFGIKVVGSNGKDITSRVWFECFIYNRPRYEIGEPYITRHGLVVPLTAGTGWERNDDSLTLQSLSSVAPGALRASDFASEPVRINDGEALFRWADAIRRPVGWDDKPYDIAINARPWYAYEDGAYPVEASKEIADASTAPTPTVSTLASRGSILLTVAGACDSVRVYVRGAHGQVFDFDAFDMPCPGETTISTAPYGDVTLEVIGFTENGISETVVVRVANPGTRVDFVPLGDGKRASVEYDISDSWDTTPQLEAVQLLGRKFQTVGYGSSVESSGSVTGSYVEATQGTYVFELLPTAGPVMVRYPNGTRRVCAVTGVSTSAESPIKQGLRSVTVSLTEVEW